MVLNLITLISRNFGISKSACQTVGKSFQRTRYHLAAKNGISKKSFGYKPETPIFGSWQGAMKSIVSWMLASSVIQKIHLTTVEGARFESKDGKTVVSLSTICFVDDNNCFSQEKGEGLIVEKLQRSA